jgi:hypothetical protein
MVQNLTETDRLLENMPLRHAITALSLLDGAFKSAVRAALALHTHCSKRREALALKGGCRTKNALCTCTS